MICPKCGMELAEGSTFCSQCGFNLTQLSRPVSDPGIGQAASGQIYQPAAQPSQQYQAAQHVVQPANPPQAQPQPGQQYSPNIQAQQPYQQQAAQQPQYQQGNAFTQQQYPAQQYPTQPVSPGVIPRKQKKYAESKSAIMALLLSLFIVGLGQFYNGDTKKGIVMLVSAVVGGLISLTLLWWVAAIYSSIDAYMVASKKWPLWT